MAINDQDHDELPTGLTYATPANDSTRVDIAAHAIARCLGIKAFEKLSREQQTRFRVAAETAIRVYNEERGCA